MIPSKCIITCDACGLQGERGRTSNFRYNGGVVVERDALDFQGAPVANATVRRDLCDDCVTDLSEVVNKWAESRKGRHG